MRFSVLCYIQKLPISLMWLYIQKNTYIKSTKMKICSIHYHFQKCFQGLTFFYNRQLLRMNDEKELRKIKPGVSLFIRESKVHVLFWLEEGSRLNNKHEQACGIHVIRVPCFLHVTRNLPFMAFDENIIFSKYSDILQTYAHLKTFKIIPNLSFWINFG